METDVYRQYFAADCVFNGVQRNGALVTLTATSECGNISYKISATFFPHNDPEDFAVSYDAYVSQEIYNQKGRRSKKRERQFMEDFRQRMDELAKSIKATIFWDRPLRDAETLF